MKTAVNVKSDDAPMPSTSSYNDSSVPILVIVGDVNNHQNPANAQGVYYGDAHDMFW